MQYKNNDGYEELANKIIVQACQDFLAYRRYRADVKCFFVLRGLLCCLI